MLSIAYSITLSYCYLSDLVKTTFDQLVVGMNDNDDDNVDNDDNDNEDDDNENDDDDDNHDNDDDYNDVDNDNDNNDNNDEDDADNDNDNDDDDDNEVDDNNIIFPDINCFLYLQNNSPKEWPCLSSSFQEHSLPYKIP